MQKAKIYLIALILILSTSIVFLTTTSFTNTTYKKPVVKIVYDTVSFQNSSDTITYKPTITLNWNDFKAVPNMQDEAVANSSVGFKYSATINTDEKGNVTVQIKTSSFFIRSKSWGKQNSKSNYIIQHEQKHFDIARYGAELFKQNILKQKITATNVNDVINTSYENAWNAYLQLQSAYDNETNHSINKVQQAKWSKKIEKLIQQCKY